MCKKQNVLKYKYSILIYFVYTGAKIDFEILICMVKSLFIVEAVLEGASMHQWSEWCHRHYHCPRWSVQVPTHHPDSIQQPNAFIRPLRCLSSNPLGRKVGFNMVLRHAANSTVVCTFCACARCNKWVALFSCAQSIPPTHPAELLEHR